MAEFKAFRVDFSYTEQAAIHIAAKDEAEASAGAVAMLQGKLKNPVVVRVTDVTEAELPSEGTVFPPTVTMN